MPSQEVDLVFAFQDLLGGVARFNQSLLAGRCPSDVVRRVILLREEEDLRPRCPESFDSANEVRVFRYSRYENRRCVAKRLMPLISDRKGAVITSDELVLQTVGLHGRSKTLFHVVHDPYFLKQDLNYAPWIDFALTHSRWIQDQVAGSLFLPYGVRQVSWPDKPKRAQLRLAFLGRLVAEKGVLLLFEMDLALKRLNILVEWSFIGQGALRKALEEQWQGRGNVHFHEPRGTDGVYALLKDQDVLVFPTEFDGTPVAILEALSNGVVPIVTDLPGGIQECVTEEVGFRVPFRNLELFVEKIAQLDKDRDLLRKMQVACHQKAQEEYDVVKNSDHFIRAVLDRCARGHQEKPRLTALGRLDRPSLPNFLVKGIRASIQFLNLRKSSR